jgi:hypothetical protein
MKSLIPTKNSNPQEKNDACREALNCLIDALGPLVQGNVAKYCEVEDELQRCDKAMANFTAAQMNLIQVMNDQEGGDDEDKEIMRQQQAILEKTSKRNELRCSNAKKRKTQLADELSTLLIRLHDIQSTPKEEVEQPPKLSVKIKEKIADLENTIQLQNNALKVTNKKLEEMHKTKKTEIDELVKRHKAELEKLNKEHNENLGQLRDENTYVSDELTTCQSLLNALQEGNTSSRVNNSEPQRLRKRPASVMEKE